MSKSEKQPETFTSASELEHYSRSRSRWKTRERSCIFEIDPVLFSATTTIIITFISVTILVFVKSFLHLKLVFLPFQFNYRQFNVDELSYLLLVPFPL